MPVAGVGEFAVPIRRSPPVSRWHPGGIRRCSSGEPLLVPADRLAIDPSDAFDLPLAGAGLQQGPDGCLQMWLQDVHSWYPLGVEGVESNVLLGPDQPALPA